MNKTKSLIIITPQYAAVKLLMKTGEHFMKVFPTLS